MQQQHRGQRNWLEFFDQAERQFQARAQLLDGLPIDRRVVALLKALDEIARKELSQGRDGAAILRDGTVEISVPIGVIEWALNVSRNTARAYIDLAGKTPYFGGVAKRNSAHTYHVRWPAIVDDSRKSGRTTVSEGPTANEPGGGQSGGQTGGQSGGQSAGQFDPRSALEGGEGFKGFLRSELNTKKNPPHPPLPSGSGGQSKWLPADYWRRWRDAVGAADLSDPMTVEELYGLAVSYGCFPDTELNRRLVFYQAAKACRPGTAKFPKRIFAVNVAAARWFHSLIDEDAGGRMMAALNAIDRPRVGRHEGALVAAHAAAQDELAELGDQAASQRHQLAALKKFGSGK